MRRKPNLIRIIRVEENRTLPLQLLGQPSRCVLTIHGWIASLKR